MLAKVKGWLNITWQDNIAEEAFELSEAVQEMGEKLYSKVQEYFWDVGEIMYYKKKMERAKDWKTWKKAAIEVDKLEGKDDWRYREQSPMYDYKLLRGRLKLIRSLQQSGEVEALVHHLRSGLFRGLGGNLHPELYNKCLVGTKSLIIEYQKEVKNALNYILNSQTFPMKDKVTFFTESRYAYGRTALLLSGGGGLGLYHLGVVKTLYEKNLLPKIIAGTSAGSIVAAFICTTVWKDIPRWFEPGKIRYGPDSGLESGSLFKKFRKFIERGYMLDISLFEKFLRDNLGEFTFEEAYLKTGLILNITVSETNEFSDFRLMNYLTAPHVFIWSAVLASCAIPFVFEAVELKCKNHKGETVLYHPSGLKFIDGSIKADLPMQRLSELFNVNAFIVSQTNPWVIPLLSPDDGGGLWGDSFQFKLLRLVKRLCLMEFRYRVQQLNLIGMCNFLTWVLGIFTQEYRGHVTIWPIPHIRDYVNIISNPTQDDIQRCIKKGQNRTFPKIGMLKSIMAIEADFDFCCSELKSRLSNCDISPKGSVDEETDDNTIAVASFPE